MGFVPGVTSVSELNQKEVYIDKESHDEEENQMENALADSAT